MPLPYEPIARQAFAEVTVDKGLTRSLRLEERGIPTFVAEWLVDREQRRQPGADVAALDAGVRAFVADHLPRKEHKERLRNRLLNGEVLSVLDNFRATVDLRRERRLVEIPSLDEKGEVDPAVVDQFEGLLGGGLWGAGKLVYVQPTASEKGAVWLRAFNPLQAADVDPAYYRAQRARFSVEDWSALMVSSMGYNPAVYDTPRLRTLLLSRLLPLAQRRLNLIELAPKGTGKSFVFSNLSRHARVVSGGKVSAPVLFYNNATNEPGLLTRYATLVFDEAQTISFDNPGEVVGILKDYMESGRFTRGRQSASADCGVVFLGNIQMAGDRPLRPVYFEELPTFLQETAFITRIHGFVPGWEIPKIRSDSPAEGVALKADYFSEVLHGLRDDGAYDGYVERHARLSGEGSGNMRNATAVKRLAAGYLKLFFPDLAPSPSEFEAFCLRPAVELRQRVCEQLSQLDPGEFSPTALHAEPASAA